MEMKRIWDWLSGVLGHKDNKIKLVLRHATRTACSFRFNQIIT